MVDWRAEEDERRSALLQQRREQDGRWADAAAKFAGTDDQPVALPERRYSLDAVGEGRPMAAGENSGRSSLAETIPWSGAASMAGAAGGRSVEIGEDLESVARSISSVDSMMSAKSLYSRPKLQTWQCFTLPTMINWPWNKHCRQIVSIIITLHVMIN